MAELNLQDMVDELRYDMNRRDMTKAQIVLSHLKDIDEEGQKRLLFELSRGEAEFTVPLLVYLITRYKEMSESQHMIKEILISKLLDYPDILVKLLSDPAIENKLLLINIAGEIRLEKAVPILLDILLASEDTELMKMTMETLGMIGDPAAINTLTDFLYSGKRELVIAAIRSLGDIGSPTAMHRLSERMGTDNELDLLVLKMFALSQDTLSLSKLNETLGSHYAHMRNFARSALVKIGTKSVPILLDNLQYDDPDLQILSLNTLGEIGDGSAIGSIRKLLNNEPKNPNIRFAAYEALSLLPLEKGAYVLAVGLTDSEEHVRVAAARAIDRNFNDVLNAGIKNMVRFKDGDAKKVVETIIVAQADKVFLSLAAEDFFQELAGEYLLQAHKDVCSHYYNLLIARGFSEFAEKILPKKEEKAKKLRICAVDDSRMILSIYKSTLHKLGFEPVLFEFPKSALEWLEKEKPDALLTDLNMPEITGIELSEKVRLRYSHRDLPIIMVTTQNDIQDNEAAYGAGVDKILYKPFNPTSLREAIAEFINV